MSASHTAPSALAPFKAPAFRNLWLTWLVANLCMWMNDVAAAWIMTSLTPSPVWVALVQSAATLPVFLLALPSGALADGIDRKKYFMLTQIWVAAVASVLAVVTWLDGLTPELLLLLIFANGIGLAMRWPVFAAILPELVSKPQLPAALALNSVAMNASRIGGPLLAGALIAIAGSVWVFALNAVLSLAAALVIARWKREHQPHPLGREPLLTSMRVGLQYIAQSGRLKAVLLRIWIFFLSSSALVALLPLVARGMQDGSAGTFTLLLAAMGSGAIASTMLLAHLRHRYTRDGLLLRAALLQAVSMLVMAQTHNLWIALPAMFLSGMTVVTTANMQTVSFQLSLPDWVRARGMSVYFMTLMGASACGAAWWGQLAAWTGLSASISVAAVTGVAAIALVIRLRPEAETLEDLSPRRLFPTPQHPAPPPSGKLWLSIEYQVDPESAAEFRELMLSQSRAARLRQGALSWELMHDISDPGSFIEVSIERSWTDHLRRFERITAADAELHERKLAFHIGSEPPCVKRYLIETRA
ncbi:arabinose ABC transporter permease [Malikia spinosa]|uniref:Arabinose ABC transporter permease n=1 Tax=Malikia spinosa TaxID=86180 RepID=A0A2S9KAM3_9BURK|nr:MFS transporter [Malikia spinosa]PRD67519.1 arabinose ABC transporter permease [Malikia spinosa]